MTWPLPWWGQEIQTPTLRTRAGAKSPEDILLIMYYLASPAAVPVSPTQVLGEKEGGAPTSHEGSCVDAHPLVSLTTLRCVHLWG